MSEWDDEVVDCVAEAIAIAYGQDHRTWWKNESRAALDELERILEERGLRVVPVEPTATMCGVSDGVWSTAALRQSYTARYAIAAAPPLRDLLERS